MGRAVLHLGIGSRQELGFSGCCRPPSPTTARLDAPLRRCAGGGVNHIYHSVMRTEVPWQRLIAEELTVAPVVIVRDLVRRQVGRDPSTAELSAARRAAHRYAASGNAQIVRVRASATDDRAPLLAVAGTSSEPVPPATMPRRGRPRSDLVVMRGLARTLSGASRAAQLIDVTTLSSADASELGAELTDSLRRLAALRMALLTHARTAPAVAG